MYLLCSKKKVSTLKTCHWGQKINFEFFELKFEYFKLNFKHLLNEINSPQDANKPLGPLKLISKFSNMLK